jgi:hypothetical protein
MRGLPTHEATVAPAEPISPGQGERTSAAFVSFLRLLGVSLFGRWRSGRRSPEPLGHADLSAHVLILTLCPGAGSSRDYCSPSPVRHWERRVTELLLLRCVSRPFRRRCGIARDIGSPTPHDVR